MNEHKINPGYFLLLGLVLIFSLTGVFYFIKQRAEKIVEPDIDSNISTEPLAQDIHSEFEAEVPVDIMPINASDYVLGNTDAELEMIVYDDPSEMFAPAYYENIKTVIEEFGDKIKIAIRPLPLEINKNTDYFSIALLCAGEQGEFFEMYQELVDANRDKRLVSDYSFGSSSAYSLDLAKFKDCQASEKMLQIIEDRKAEADASTIIGVPSTFINGYPYPGAYPLDDFIDSAEFEREGLRTVINSQLGITN